MKELFQPILTQTPEPGHELSNVLSVQEFINLLRKEEDYYEGEQHNTKLMITRLRKIFYDQCCWNRELIRGASGIDMRYRVDILDHPVKHAKAVRRFADNEYEPRHRLITYKTADREYGDTRAGQVPDVYKNGHQETRLPEGTYCDIAHVLAGLDALNHQHVVSPVPRFLRKILPHVDSNADVVTWLGDIASASSDFLFCYLSGGKKKLTAEQEQHYIDTDAPGSDMLGDIDPFVIFKHYDVSTANGRRITDILEEYYCDSSNDRPLRARRYSIFCEVVGLRGWDGQRFSNEQDWLKYYGKQLRDNVAFQVFSLTEGKISGMWLSLCISLGAYKDVIKHDMLLRLFLESLKTLIKTEK